MHALFSFLKMSLIVFLAAGLAVALAVLPKSANASANAPRKAAGIRRGRESQ